MRFHALYLVVGLTFALTACGGEGDVSSHPEDASQTTAPMETTPPITPIAYDPAPAGWVSPLGVGARAAMLHDVSGDGVLDLVVAAESVRGVEVFEGDGRAGFSTPLAMPLPAPDEQTEFIASTRALLKTPGGELIACQGDEGALVIHRGDFEREPVASTGARPLGCAGLVMGDFDGDGADDLAEIVATRDGSASLRLWRMTRTGSAITLGALVKNDAEGIGFTLPDHTAHALASVDLDGDGASELVLAANRSIYRVIVANDAVAARVLVEDVGQVGALSGLDADGDGDLDLHVGVIGGQDRLLLSDGAGHLADATWSSLPVEDAASVSVTPIDLDGDATLDLVVGTSGGYDRLYRGKGDGRFEDLTPALGFVETDTIALLAGDLDGDQDLDLVSVGRDGHVQVFSRRGGQRPEPGEGADAPMTNDDEEGGGE